MIRLFRQVLLALLASIAFCLQAQAAAPTPHTARDMWNMYMSTPTDCGDSRRPAFLCSGIIIRVAYSGVTKDARPLPYYSWDLSPNDLKSGGASFSYLRKDVVWNDLKGQYSNNADGSVSGFTLYPLMGTYAQPAGKYVMQVLCSFPLDGWTYERDALHGCGATTKYGSQPTGECQPQGIMTAEQWVAHYKATPKGENDKEYQCGFDVHTGSQYNTVDAFNQSLRARAVLDPATHEFTQHNELRIASWNNAPVANLPIQSFFYAVPAGQATSQALTDAKFNQQVYYQNTGIFIPIVQVSIPAKYGDDYDFHVLPGDQAVPFPTPK
jgi:hypothetical protein